MIDSEPAGPAVAAEPPPPPRSASQRKRILKIAVNMPSAAGANPAAHTGAGGIVRTASHGRSQAKYGAPVKGRKKKDKIQVIQIVHLVHRMAIFFCAVFFIFQSFRASYVSIGLLRGRDNPSVRLSDDRFELMHTLAGDGAIRSSPIIKWLGDRTDPINGTIYLEKTGPTFTMCAVVPEDQRGMYEDDFLRTVFQAVQDGLAYHDPDYDVSMIELVAPVIDCSATDIQNGDSTSGRYFFIIRDIQDHEAAAILVMSLSNQQYKIPAQGQSGPAAIATVQHIHDMTKTSETFHFIVSIGYPFEVFNFRAYKYINTTTDGQWTLQSIPKNDLELPKVLLTSCRSGFYIKAESEQSNINNLVWGVDMEPHNAIRRQAWHSTPVLHDSWAWVHAIQFFIGFGVLSNLAILCIATYHNFIAGKLWIGDAFVTISTSQLLNGALVIISWFMNEYWCLHEFSFSNGYAIAKLDAVYIYEAHMHADLLTIYLSAVGLIGTALRERVDPLFAILTFELGFNSRIFLMNLVSSIRTAIKDYAIYADSKGVIASIDGQSRISPLKSFNSHPIGKRSYAFVFRCLFPIYTPLLLVLVYATARKVYHHYYPEPLHIQRTANGTNTSDTNEEALTAQKRVLTLFEIATGAELENRFGLVSDYETCIFIKGMKFASADGIYSNGFVIANKKYLVQTRDVWSILMMKILRKRYKNIYIYEVNGNTVQQTARLVYPHTLSLTDLLSLNVSILS